MKRTQLRRQPRKRTTGAQLICGECGKAQIVAVVKSACRMGLIEECSFAVSSLGELSPKRSLAIAVDNHTWPLFALRCRRCGKEIGAVLLDGRQVPARAFEVKFVPLRIARPVSVRLAVRSDYRTDEETAAQRRPWMRKVIKAAARTGLGVHVDRSPNGTGTDVEWYGVNPYIALTQIGGADKDDDFLITYKGVLVRTVAAKRLAENVRRLQEASGTQSFDELAAEVVRRATGYSMCTMEDEGFRIPAETPDDAAKTAKDMQLRTAEISAAIEETWRDAVGGA